MMENVKIVFKAFGTVVAESLQNNKKKLFFLSKFVIICLLSLWFASELYNFAYNYEYTIEETNYFKDTVSQIWNEGFNGLEYDELKFESINDKIDLSFAMTNGLSTIDGRDIEVALTIGDAVITGPNSETFEVADSVSAHKTIIFDFSDVEPNGEPQIITRIDSDTGSVVVTGFILAFVVLNGVWFFFKRIFNYLIINNIVNFGKKVYGRYTMFQADVEMAKAAEFVHLETSKSELTDNSEVDIDIATDTDKEEKASLELEETSEASNTQDAPC